MFNSWIEVFTENLVSAVIILNISEAIDVVDHEILLNKMDMYGYEESALSWLKRYISSIGVKLPIGLHGKMSQRMTRKHL